MLFEANDMLDISIKNIDKEFNNDEKINQFLNSEVTIYEKYDGTKMSIIRNDQPYSNDYRKNWIISYKNNIIYSTEFSGMTDTTGSIGTSQYKIVHDHLKSVQPGTKSIPRNTEFFIEYLMAKPTLTRDYTKKNAMVLLAYSPAEVKVGHGMVKTRPKGFYTEDRKYYANILKMTIPKVLYKGPLKDIVKHSNNESPTAMLAEIKKRLLSVESEFGGKTEGVVIELQDGSMYKFLQADQHDKETRNANKMKYKADSFEEENQYWANVRKIAVPLANKVPKDNLKKGLQNLSKFIYSKDLPIQHPKKKGLQIKDDVFLTAKMVLIKQLEGNNGALFVGRFSPPTKAHTGIVGKALQKFDTVTLNIVKSGKLNAENPFPIELQERMWKTVYPSLNIQISRTGNLITIINKADENINVVITGTDRKAGYENQLARMPDVSVMEIPRTSEDISASKVRKALVTGDEKTFQSLMDPRLHSFYDELRQLV